MKQYNNYFLKTFYPLWRAVRISSYKKLLEDAIVASDFDGGKTLIVACGPCFELPIICSFAKKETSIDAFDFSDEMIALGKKKISKIDHDRCLVNLYLGDAEDATHFKKDFYETIFVVLGLSVIPDYKKALANIYESLEKGGKVIVIDSQTPKEKGLITIFTDLFNKYFAKAHDRPLKEELEKLFEKVESKGVNTSHFYWIGKKS